MPSPNTERLRAIQRRATQLGVLAALLLVLHLGLLGALLSAVASYTIYVHVLGVLARRISSRGAAALALGLTIVAIGLVSLLLVESVHAFWTPRGLPGLLELLADTLDRLRTALPEWLSSRLPASLDDVRQLAAQWLRGNARGVQRWGQEILRVMAHLFVGLIIGLLAAFERGPRITAPWMLDVGQCWRALALAFAEFFSAQLRIAAANTLLTALFLLVVLPAAGVHLPLAWTLIALTFFLGLVPIVGNLGSNGAILLVALTVSSGVAAAALGFLLAIHKLEYFLNAHFVGERTSVPSPVLLAAMIVLEAAFGLAGLIAAPIYCAWVFLQFGGNDTSA